MYTVLISNGKIHRNIKTLYKSDTKSIYKHIMHHIKINVHSKITLGNKTDNQTPLIMQGKVQNITNKQKNEILKQEE
jgi:hypothetical protein